MDTSTFQAISIVFCLAIPSASTAASPATSAASTMEELIVTGTHIEVERYDNARPLHTLSRDDIERAAMPSLGHILAHQTFNYGSNWISNEYALNSPDGNRTSANLRGLGSGATLLLMNGQRTVDTNLNNLYPQIAVDRVETVLNGASAVYGSDAVAGVVNLIPRTTYEGAQLGLFVNGDGRGDHKERDISFLFGKQRDRGQIVFAAEYRYRDRMRQRDRAQYLRGGFSYSSGSPVPNVSLSLRDPADGTLSGRRSSTMDPGCGAWDGPGGTDIAARQNHMSGRPRGQRSALSTGFSSCQFTFGEFHEFVAENRSLNLWSYFDHAINDHVSLEIEALYTRQEAENRGSPSNPWSQTEFLPTIAGEHPGNPFRAMVDTNGDGVLDAAIQATDGSAFLAANGVADRDCDGNGTVDSVAEAQLGEGNTDCTVIVGDATTDADGDGAFDLFDQDFGVAFNEDVDLLSYRVFGKLGTLPNSINKDGSNIGASKFDSDNVRASAKLHFFIPNSTWGGRFTALHHRNEFKRYIKNERLNALQEGLLGAGGASGSEYFNPFATHTLICADRVCRLPAQDGSENSLLVENSQALVDGIAIRDDDRIDSDLTSVDLVVAGSPVDLPAGPLDVAVGAEWRRSTRELDANQWANACDIFGGARCEADYDASQGVGAGFFELLIPVFDTGRFGSLDVQVAGRYEDAGSGLSSFDPKFSGHWRPREWVSVRASWGTAYIIPTLTQQFQGARSTEWRIFDPITGSGTFRDRTNTFSGNDELSPEEATVWNVGASFTWLDGDLEVSIDHAVFDFDTRIVKGGPQPIVDADGDAFGAAGNTDGDLGDVTAWMCENGGPGDCRIRRSPTGEIQEVLTSFFNSDEMRHVSSDAFVSYRFRGEQLPWIGGDYGSFNLQIHATWVHKYEFEGPDIGQGDAAGSQNDYTGSIPPIPRLQANGMFGWQRGGFSAHWRTRFIQSVRGDSPFFGADGPCTAFGGALFGTIFGGGAVTCASRFDSVFYHDVGISFRSRELLGGDRTATFTVGANNVLDKLVEPLFLLGGLETLLYDPRGRMIYGSVSVML